MKKATNLLFIAALFFCNTLHAQFIYPNEDCSGAMPIPVNTTGQLSDSVYQRNVYGAAVISPIPNCTGTSPYYDLWYKFTATDTSIAVVPEYFAARYQLFSGGCGSLTSVACNPSSSSFPPISGLVPGQTYYLRTYTSLNTINSVSNYKLSLLGIPTNDNCSGAVLLPVSSDNNLKGAGRFKNEFATASNTSCVNTPGWTNLNDIWFKFVATHTEHTVFLSAGKFACYSGTPGNFTLLSSFTGNLSGITTTIDGLTIGQTYYIRVGSTNTVQFELAITSGKPVNDECASADTVLMSSSFNCEHTYTFTRTGANTSASACSAILKDVWFAFQATSPDVIVRAHSDDGNTRLGLQSGSCGSLTCLTYSTNSELTYSGLTVGNYYYVNVGGSPGEADITSLCICPAVANDECINAVTLTMQPYKVLHDQLGYDVGATSSLPECSGSQPTKDVWYKFTATDTACLIIALSEGTSPEFEVFSGNCNSLNSIFCSQLNTGNRIGGLINGDIYYVRFYTLSLNGLHSVNILHTVPNDECAQAITLPLQSDLLINYIESGLLDATQSMAPCSLSGYNNDIWYKFTATHTSAAVISNSIIEFSFPTTLGTEVFSGGCGNLTSMRCNQPTPIKHDVFTYTNLTPGQTYYIRNYGNIRRATTTVIDAPANDNIIGAFKLTPSAAGVQSIPSYYTHGASSQFDNLCGTGSPHHDVWFYFIAGATSHNIAVNSYNSYWDEQPLFLTFKIEAFDGFAPDSASLVQKIISCGSNTLSLSNLTVGDTVYIRVYDTGTIGNSDAFSIHISNSEGIDHPAGALQLNLTNDYQYAVSTSGATQSLPASGCIINDYPDDDIWFKFTAGAGTKRIIAGFETKMITLQLFSGTPGNLNPIKCSNNILVLPDNLTNGTIYYVRAYTKATAEESTFKIGLYNNGDPIANSCIASNCLGANLVANPECEDHGLYLLPKNDDFQAIIPGSKLADGWWSHTYATADSWNADYPLGEYGDVPGEASGAEITIPRGGKGMLGLLYYGGWYEYVTGKLSQPLVAGKNYLVSFNAIMSSYRAAAQCSMVGAFLSNDSINVYASELLFRPHIYNDPGNIVDDTKNWENVCGVFHADQSYDYITIGNFGPQQIYGNLQLNGGNASYFFIDDVVVAEILCPTGVEENSLDSKSKMTLSVFPNPAKDFVNVQWSLIHEDVELFVNDISGRLLWKSGIVKGDLSQMYIETEHFQPGFYTITLQGKQTKAASKFIISK